MVVGVLRLSYSLPGNATLKGKRQIVRRIVERTRNRFNAAVSEVDLLDEPRRAVLGVAVTSNEGSHANEMLDKIQAFTLGLTEAVLVDSRIELIPVGELEHGLVRDTGYLPADWSEDR